MLTKNEAKDTIFCKKHLLNLGGKLYPIERPMIMGILNITPDSFHDGGKYNTASKAVERVHQMLDEGADIIDIGPSSTRPGAAALSAKEEIERMAEVLPELKKHFPDTIFSLDTYQAEVARAGADMGVHIINDISGGTMDADMPKAVADIKLPYVLMHIKGTPQNMQKAPQYKDVFEEVCYFLSRQMNTFLEAGVADIIIDPGFGFGKTVEHNYELLAKLDLFKIFQRPLLVGVSRKSMINKLLDISAQDALNGTTVVNTLALQKGADILRVHDVKAAAEAAKIVTFTQNYS